MSHSTPIYPTSFDNDVQSKGSKKKSLQLPLIVIAIALLIFVIICIIIGVACYYGGKNAATPGEPEPEPEPEKGEISRVSTTSASYTSTKEPSAEEMRLPKNLLPVKYWLSLKTYLPSKSVTYSAEKNFTFDAEIGILMECLESTNSISLNALDLNISAESFSLQESDEDGTTNGRSISLRENGMEMKEKLQMVVFQLNSNLESGKFYNLSLKYRGLISDKLAGLYRSHYKENDEVK